MQIFTRVLPDVGPRGHDGSDYRYREALAIAVTPFFPG
jgi:hypothetical protein